MRHIRFLSAEKKTDVIQLPFSNDSEIIYYMNGVCVLAVYSKSVVLSS